MFVSTHNSHRVKDSARIYVFKKLPLEGKAGGEASEETGCDD